MPVYKYIGKAPYINSSLGVYAECDQIVSIPFFFDHPDFILLDPTVNTQQVVRSEDFVLSDTVKLTVDKYSVLSFRLVSDGAAEIRVGHHSVRGTLLDASAPLYVCRVEKCIGTDIYLCPVDGQPVVRVYYNCAVRW